VLLETIIWNEDQMARRRRLEIPRLERAVDRLTRFIGIAAPVGRLDPVWLVWWHILARQEDEEEVQKRIAEIEQAGVTDIAEIVRYGIGRGEFGDVDAEVFAMEFMALLDGLSVNVVTGSTGITRDRMLEMALRNAARELQFDPNGLRGSSLAEPRSSDGAGARSEGLVGAPRETES
jgi:hypothetical protein